MGDATEKPSAGLDHLSQSSAPSPKGHHPSHGQATHTAVLPCPWALRAATALLSSQVHITFKCQGGSGRGLNVYRGDSQGGELTCNCPRATSLLCPLFSLSISKTMKLYMF